MDSIGSSYSFRNLTVGPKLSSLL